MGIETHGEGAAGVIILRIDHELSQILITELPIKQLIGLVSGIEALLF